MNEIIFDIHVDAKTVLNIVFFGTLGYSAAKASVNLIKNIAKKQKINTDIFNE